VERHCYAGYEDDGELPDDEIGAIGTAAAAVDDAAGIDVAPGGTVVVFAVAE